MNLPVIYPLTWEKEALGLSLTEHPIHRIRRIMELTRGTLRFCDLNATYPGQPIEVVCVITAIQPYTTRMGKQMMYVTASDGTGSVTLTIFPKTLLLVSGSLILDSMVIVSGKASHRQETKKQKEVETDSEDTEEEVSSGVRYEVIVEKVEQLVL